MLWKQPLSQLKEASLAYAEFRSALRRRHNSYWRNWAHWVRVRVKIRAKFKTEARA